MIDPHELWRVIDAFLAVKSMMALFDSNMLREWQAELKKKCGDPKEAEKKKPTAEKPVIRRRRAGGCQVIRLADRR